jgi:hypothetical protein
VEVLTFRSLHQVKLVLNQKGLEVLFESVNDGKALEESSNYAIYSGMHGRLQKEPCNIGPQTKLNMERYPDV